MRQPSPLRSLGLVQILLSGFCFGFLGIFGKWAYEFGLKPGEFLSLRFLLASAFLALFLLVQNPAQLRVSKKVFGRSVLLGLGGYAVFSSCFFFALEGLSASLTVLLLYTYPILVCLGGWALFGERPTNRQLLALPLVVGGLALLVWGEMEVREPRYLVFGFCSAVFYAGYILTSSRLLKGVPAFSSTLYIMLAAGVGLGVWHLRALPAEPAVWATMGATALISSLLAMGLFLAALQKLSNAEASLLSAAEPVTGLVLAALVLGESLQPRQWAGGGLVLAGMALVAVAGKKSEASRAA